MIEDFPAPEVVADLARRLSDSDGALLIVDGLRFPAERFSATCGDGWGRRRPWWPAASLPRGCPWPGSAPGFSSRSGSTRRLPGRDFPWRRDARGGGARLEPGEPRLHGHARRGEGGNVVHEIDGEPAVEWYRRFFTVGAEIAPMPDTAWRFPLIIEGPPPSARGSTGACAPSTIRPAP